MIAYDTDQHFEAVCRILSDCRGAENAITLDVLTFQAGLPHRRITEQLIEQRLGDFPFILVAGGAGYYIPTDADEINRYVHNLHSRHRRMQLREQTVIRKARAAGYIYDGDRFANPPSAQGELFA